MKIKRNKKCFSKLTIAEGRKQYHGVNGILTHHHIIGDLYIGLGRYAIRIIPFSYIDLINSIDLPWDTSLVAKYQPRYSSVTKWKDYPILGKYNDW